MSDTYDIDKYDWIDFADALTPLVEKLCGKAYDEGWAYGIMHALEITDEEREQLRQEFSIGQEGSE